MQSEEFSREYHFLQERIQDLERENAILSNKGRVTFEPTAPKFSHTFTPKSDHSGGGHFTPSRYQGLIN